MGCLIVLMALLVPRFTMIFIWLLTDWIGQAYNSFIWPFLGFFFMPYTTLAYMAGQLNGGITNSAFYMIIFIVAIIIDAFGWMENITKEESNEDSFYY